MLMCEKRCADTSPDTVYVFPEEEDENSTHSAFHMRPPSSTELVCSRSVKAGRHLPASLVNCCTVPDSSNLCLPEDH